MAHKKNNTSDLQGLASLITEATIGITDLVETMHRRVVHPLFLPSTPIQHLITKFAGFTYSNIRSSTKLIGSGVDKALGQFASVFGDIKPTDKKEAISAVLNGVIGDYLKANDNPLQITMQFRHGAETIGLTKKSLKKSYPTANGKILVMVHGSCMNDMQWTRNGHNHGLLLAEELHKTPIYLHYNSGLHISTNGHYFNDLLEKLVKYWPVPVEELIIIGHSMGGLVARSTIYYGQQQKKNWVKHLKKVVFLGTPHHGALMEQAGNYADVILETIPYSKPFARLGKIRSSGVTDLRYGNIVDEDWQDGDRFELKGDQRQHIPLPKAIDCYSIAAIVGKASKTVTSKLVGDNMVGIKSALGQHKNKSKNLNFKEEHTWISYETNHVELLSNPNVYAKIKSWLVE